MITLPRAGAALLCLVSISEPHHGEQLRFSVAPGTRLVREWSRESRRTLTQLTVTAGDETHTADAPAVAIESKARLLVTDVFVAVDDERPLKIERTYDTIEKIAHETATTPDGEHTVDHKELCDLSGRTIVFAWDAEHGSYGRSFQDGTASAESAGALDALVVDMDLQEFLPRTAVEPGDHWPVSIDALKHGFLRPGGRLEFHDEEGRRKSKREEALSDAAWNALEGECTATLSKIRQEEGARLCVIHLAGRISTAAEMESESSSGSAGMKHSETFDGELVWDLGAGRARAMNIQSKIDFTLIESRQGKKPDGAEVLVRRTLEFGEESTCSYEIRTP